MPNWCGNQLTLTHADPKMIDRATKAYEEGHFFNEFVPCPKELKEIEVKPGSTDPDYVKIRSTNIAKYGYSDWYSFHCGKWGTKWDVGGKDEYFERQEPTVAEFSFNTAWSPALKFYGHLTEIGFIVEAYYFEPGMCFAGAWTSKEGDDYWEYDDMTPDEIRKEMPEIDEHFCISNMLEEEQNEENEEI